MDDYMRELLQGFEEQHADPSLPGGILRKVVRYGNPVRVQYFVNWPAATSEDSVKDQISDVGESHCGSSSSPTSEKSVRRYGRASRVRVIRG
jgi:hypothetical protein